MILRLLDSPPDSGAMVYLVNALSFDGEWEEKYKAEQVRKDTFTTEEGEEQRVEFLFSDEGTYLAGEYTTGFMKSYKGGGLRLCRPAARGGNEHGGMAARHRRRAAV